MVATGEILDGVRAAIRETMCDDELRIEPEMTLLDDLLEESINMLDLQFRIHARYRVRVPGISDFQNVETDDEGQITPGGMVALRALLPQSLLNRFRDTVVRPTAKELWDAMTVEDLVNLIHMRIGPTTGG